MMKSIQMIVLLAAIVGVIFVATFASQWGVRPPETAPVQTDILPNKPIVTVSFPITTHPAVDPITGAPIGPPVLHETGVSGSHDFWFENHNETEVLVGAGFKNCTCTKVVAAVAPEGAHLKTPPYEDNSKEWQVLEPDEMPGSTKGIKVPAKRGGWVRLTWKGDKLGDQRLNVRLWTQDPGLNNPPIALEMAIRFIEALKTLPENAEHSVGDLEPRGLPRRTEFFIVSATRTDFKVTVESADEQKQKHPFVIAHEPVRLDEENLKKFRQGMRVAVLSGYKLPITVYERLEDGRIADMGPFRTVLRVTTDLSAEPIPLTVTGNVRGDITVVTDAETKDRVRLDNFSGKTGITKKAVLEGESGLELEVDRKPDFMEVELKTEGVAQSRKTWSLLVKVLPNAISGPFPRPDDALLRDTAIYLKTTSNPPRRIRIPVSGTAAQR